MQFKRGSVDKDHSGAEARVLRNPNNYFASAEGRDRKILFLAPEIPAASKPADPLPRWEGFLELLADSQLPLELEATHGVLINERKSGTPARMKTVNQWWTLHTLAAPPAKPRTPPAVAAQYIFPEKNSPWVAGRALVARSVGAVPPANGDSQPIPWTVARLLNDKLTPPDALKELWKEAPGIQPEPWRPGQELLPDQVILDDALVHWFGNSLAKHEQRRSAFESGGNQAGVPPQPGTDRTPAHTSSENRG